MTKEKILSWLLTELGKKEGNTYLERKSSSSYDEGWCDALDMVYSKIELTSEDCSVDSTKNNVHNKITSLIIEIDNFLFKLNDICHDVNYFNFGEVVIDDLHSSSELLTSSRDLLLTVIKNIK